jgi:hypothetical protein
VSETENGSCRNKKKIKNQMIKNIKILIRGSNINVRKSIEWNNNTKHKKNTRKQQESKKILLT